MADPAGADDTAIEWVEIFNPDNDDVHLTGVQLIAARVDGTNEDMTVLPDIGRK
mgnify:CR=1 FL=1